VPIIADALVIFVVAARILLMPKSSTFTKSSSPATFNK
jgi:hypothetical protein